MNLTQKLALIQRNQGVIDTLTANNTELVNGIIMENTLVNLANVPGIPPQIAMMLRRAVNGEQGQPAPARETITLLPSPAPTDEPKRTRKKKIHRHAHGPNFYDNLIIEFAKKHRGKFKIIDFRQAHDGTKGIPASFFKTTVYSKITAMTQGPKPVLKKLSEGMYSLVS